RRRTCAKSAMAGISQDTDELLEHAADFPRLLLEVAAAVPGELVLLPLPPSTFRPAPPDQPVLFEPVQDRIERPVLQLEGAAAAILDFERDLVAVQRLLPQGGEDQQLVHPPAQALRVYSHPASPSLGVCAAEVSASVTNTRKP